MTCVRFHTWWPSSADPFYQANISENTARTNYYQPGSKYVPRAFIDGIVDGGSSYSNWGNLIRSRAGVPAPVTIVMSGYFTAPLDGKVGVDVEVIGSMGFADPRVFLIITEDGAPYLTSHYNQVMRDMIPGSSGDPAPLFSPGDTVSREYDFSLDPSWVVDSCNAVVLVQDYASKEILHSATSRLTNLAVRDAGVIDLLYPGTFISCDSSYGVQVRVANFGEIDETFDVSCIIDTFGQVVYNDIETVTNLAPGDTFDLTFSPDWVVPIAHEMVYYLNVATHLAGDDSTANDSLFTSFFGRCTRDVAPVSVTWPPDTAYCTSSDEPRVVVTNLGQIDEDFDVVLSIDSSGVNLYTDTTSVSNVAPAQNATATFSTWTVPSSDGMVYDLTAWTMLTDDSDASNDTLWDTSLGWCYAWEDVYPSTIVWPVDTVLCDSMGTISVWVVNAGGFDENFDVVAEIDTNGVVLHSDTGSVFDLTAGDSTEFAVGGWTVPSLDSVTCGITFWTMLASDSVISNDTTSGSFYVFCMHHDCGVEAILAPPDTVSIDTTNVPSARVHNWGNATEAFNVICTIDGYADTQQVAALMPFTSTDVVFSDWNPATPGAYLMTVITELVNDENPQNDTASKTIWGFTAVSDGYSSRRVPLVTDVLQNRPNPVTSRTRIDYCVAAVGRAVMSVYDASGRVVRVLSDKEVKPGYYTALWNGDDAYGRAVPSGVYFYKLTVGTIEATKKTVVVR